MPLFNPKYVKNEIVEWIRHYFDENGKGCRAVVGISGGKDSSIVAALCAEALGASRVFGVLMPQGKQHDINIARKLVEFLKIEHCEINIASIADSVYGSIQDVGFELNNQVKSNSPARIRMTILYAISAIVDGRVANTCNLSEDWVGYATKFGDGAGDFSPLSRLTVTEIKAVGRELGLPAMFIDKIPEDGLTGLTDEDNLGFTYDLLDKYIRTGVCENAATKELIDRLHRINFHKLNPMPCYELN